MIPLLQPIFQGALAPLGEGLQCAPASPSDALRIEDLLRPGTLLADVLHKQARWRGSDGRDLRPIASAWTLDYLGVLLPPVVAAASLLQHVFPVAAPEVWVQLDGNGSAVRFHIRQIGKPRHGATTAERYAPLLWQHLQPLFAALASLTHVAPKILWGNTARNLEPIFDQALALTGGSASVAQDRDQLLHNPLWTQGDEGGTALHPRGNPLHGRQRIAHGKTGEHHAIKLHRQCCLYHLLPGEDYCGACPLAPRHR